MVRKWIGIAAGIALAVALAALVQAQDENQPFYGQPSWDQSGMGAQDFGDYDQQGSDAGFGDYDQDYDAGTDSYGGTYGQQGMGAGTGTYGQPGFGTGGYGQAGMGGQPYYYGYPPGYPPQPYYYGQPPAGYNQPYGYVAPGYAPPYYYQPGVSPQATTRVSGQIIDMRTINLYGLDHLFATIQTAQRRTVVADLGPADEVNQLNLKNGDTVQVTGFQNIINQRLVLTATRVRANNKTITNRPDVQLHGHIIATTSRTVRGESHVFATVVLDNGQRITADLGPRSILRDHKIRIRPNEDVVLLAHPVRVGAETIYRARSMTLAGKQISVPAATRSRSEEAREASRGTFLLD